MRRIILAAVLPLLLALPATAAAWSATPTLLSCGEADFTVTLEQTPWTYVVLEDGKQVSTGTFVSSVRQVSIGVRASDDQAHLITVTLTNHEARATQSALFIACGPPAPGKDGAPGLNGKDGTNGTNGTNGKDGSSSSTSTVIHDAPASCTSARDYRFRVRRSFDGKRIVAVTAREPGTQPKVTKKAGRFVVSWSTRGKAFPAGGVLRSMEVRATLLGGRHVRLQWLYRPCSARDGNLNDPSAAGQATGAAKATTG